MPPGPSKVTKADNALVDQLCSIASVSRIVATNLLEACNNNLEMAVNMQMEGVMTDSNGASTSTMEEEVRAPIPQRQEVLVEGPDQLAYSMKLRPRVSRSVFDKFRDFEVEAKRQEEELFDESGASCTSSSSAIVMKRKMKTLEDLFRPPLDLMFRGSFQSAREAGIATKKWLMVNVQNSSEFPCQVLNRDVWSNSAVKIIIQEHFIFWQIYHDSEDGQRYMTFYPVSEWPHIAIIDPRTGERLVQWHKMDAVSFCELVTEFLASHPSLDDPSDSSIKQLPPTQPPRKKLKSNESIIEADEKAQLEAAIKASLESGWRKGEKDVNSQEDDDNEEDNDSDTLETFHDSDSDDVRMIVSNSEASDRKETDSSPFSPEEDEKRRQQLLSAASSSTPQENYRKSQIMVPNGDEESGSEGGDTDYETEDAAVGETGDRWKLYLGLESDPESKLMLRFPDGSRESLTLPSTSKLMALVLYVASKGFSNESYELVTNFPKKRLSFLDFDASLKSVGLYPQDTVFIQKR